MADDGQPRSSKAFFTASRVATATAVVSLILALYSLLHGRHVEAVAAKAAQRQAATEVGFQPWFPSFGNSVVYIRNLNRATIRNLSIIYSNGFSDFAVARLGPMTGCTGFTVDAENDQGAPVSFPIGQARLDFDDAQTPPQHWTVYSDGSLTQSTPPQTANLQPIRVVWQESTLTAGCG